MSAPEPRTPVFEQSLKVRATRLCSTAEPHNTVDEMPCVLHKSEARRQLFTEWWQGYSVPLGEEYG